MGIRILVPVLIIVLIVAIFSAQNSAPVAINFLLWQFQASLAIVIFLCVLAGAAIGAIVGLVAKMRRRGKGAKPPRINEPRPE